MDHSVTLVTASTSGRGIYVGMTRGRQANHALVVTDSHDLGEARDVLEQAMRRNSVDVPAVTRRVQLADEFAQLQSSLPSPHLPEPGEPRSAASAWGLGID